MNPLLLLLLVGGGTYAAVKTVQAISGSSEPDPCETKLLEPPVNPYISKVGGKFAIDYAAIADALEAQTKAEHGKRDATLAALAATAASLAAASGVGVVAVPWIVAGAAVAGIALKAWDWLSGDDNSEEFKNRAIEYADRVVALGYIPGAPNQDISMKNVANVLAVDLIAIESTDPYVSWLFKAGGQLFIKWGGEEHILNLAAPYVVGEKVSEGTFPVPALCSASKKSPDTNVGRITTLAYCIALDYGVQAKADKVILAAIQGVKDYQKVFSFYPLLQDGAPICYGQFGGGGGFGAGLGAHPPPDKNCTEGHDPRKFYTDEQLKSVTSFNTDGYMKLVTFAGSSEYVCSYYAFAAGLYAAFVEAAKLACKAPPPEMTLYNVLNAPAVDSTFVKHDSYDYKAHPPPIKRISGSAMAAKSGTDIKAASRQLAAR